MPLCGGYLLVYIIWLVYVPSSFVYDDLIHMYSPPTMLQILLAAVGASVLLHVCDRQVDSPIIILLLKIVVHVIPSLNYVDKTILN